MSNIEREVKILDVNPEEIERIKGKLKEAGAIFKYDTVQKFYVYDLMDLSSRFYDALYPLKEIKYGYQYNIAKEKLRGIFDEIDRLLTNKDLELLRTRYSKNSLCELLESADPTELLRIFNDKELRDIIDRFHINPNKWIRLRESCGKTSLTIKQILKSNTQTEKQDVEETREVEMDVPSIEAGKEYLEALGYSHRNYQEKRRISFNYKGAKVEIDTWPLIPTYIEIEHDSPRLRQEIINLLGLGNHRVVSCNPKDVFALYGLNIFDYRELRFDSEQVKEPNTEKKLPKKPEDVDTDPRGEK